MTSALSSSSHGPCCSGSSRSIKHVNWPHRASCCSRSGCRPPALRGWNSASALPHVTPGAQPGQLRRALGTQSPGADGRRLSACATASTCLPCRRGSLPEPVRDRSSDPCAMPRSHHVRKVEIAPCRGTRPEPNPVGRYSSRRNRTNDQLERCVPLMAVAIELDRQALAHSFGWARPSCPFAPPETHGQAGGAQGRHLAPPAVQHRAAAAQTDSNASGPSSVFPISTSRTGATASVVRPCCTSLRKRGEDLVSKERI